MPGSWGRVEGRRVVQGVIDNAFGLFLRWQWDFAARAALDKTAIITYVCDTGSGESVRLRGRNCSDDVSGG
jgi:hypothetical protein